MTAGAAQPVKTSLTVRYTWLVPQWSTHPRHTYAEHENEASALRHAIGTLRAQAPDDSLRIIHAEIEIPGGGWSPVNPAAAQGLVPRKLIEVCADEVIPGDVVRDQGVFRAVADVAALSEACTVRLCFEPLQSYSNSLTVPLVAMVSVWRACRDG